MEKELLKHQELMVSLKNRHLDLLQLIGGRPVHLLDIPVYGNVGDLLILQGTQKFLRDNRIRPVQIASIHNFQDCVKPGDVLLFQGGGNFGDLYPVHQVHREEIIARYPNNRAIVLPQSIHFESDAKFEQCAQALRKHPDLHILVRDQASLDKARHLTPHCSLMPDMAHQLYSASIRPEDSGRRLLFKRLDKESREADIDQVWHARTDWDLLIAREMKTIAFFRRQLDRFAKYRLDWLVMKCWLLYKDRLISKSERFFLEHDFVITDRLHGHILASLLNTPHCVLDNSYGKNSGYIRAWTGASPMVTLGAS